MSRNHWLSQSHGPNMVKLETEAKWLFYDINVYLNNTSLLDQFTDQVRGIQRVKKKDWQIKLETRTETGYHVQIQPTRPPLKIVKFDSKNLDSPQAHRFCFATSTSLKVASWNLNGANWHKGATVWDFSKFHRCAALHGQRTIVVVLVRTMAICYPSSLLI